MQSLVICIELVRCSIDSSNHDITWNIEALTPKLVARIVAVDSASVCIVSVGWPPIRQEAIPPLYCSSSLTLDVVDPDVRSLLKELFTFDEHGFDVERNDDDIARMLSSQLLLIQ